MKPLLIFVPTYNESGNIQELYQRLKALQLDTDFLLLDDNSPDGTGKIMDSIAASDPRVHVIHRSGKLGIGSAHREGITWAFEKGYQKLVTMDADFTHSPEAIPSLLAQSDQNEVVVASRYMKKQSLKGWNLYRKCMTNTGHVLTRFLLNLEFDATGAFRVYRLDRITPEFLGLVESNGYAFFFESLFILHRNHYRIAEVANALPPRTYGSSKMSAGEVGRGVRQLFNLSLRSILYPDTVLLQGKTGSAVVTPSYS